MNDRGRRSSRVDAPWAPVSGLRSSVLQWSLKTEDRGPTASSAFTRAHGFIDAAIDDASLAAFRILFGGLMAVAMVRFIALGWVDEFYVRPAFHFTWALAPWVRPLPPALMHLLFVLLAVLPIGIAAGVYSRACAALFFAGFTYVELIDKTTYLNHYYLVSLLSALLVVVPAHRLWALDTRWRGRQHEERDARAWSINILRFQIAVVYVFAGLAKISHDWLVDAQPLRIWLAARSDLPVVGPVLDHAWTAHIFSWCGAFYDLSIVFFLLSRRTRPWAFAAVIVFHAVTALLFPIGMFPWIMIVATTIFFPPDWPRRLLRGAPEGAPYVRRSRRYVFHVRGAHEGTPSVGTSSARVARHSLALMAIHVAIQIAVPLRGYWPGTDPEWTGRGFNYAWRVMIAEKAGAADFIVSQRSTGARWHVASRDYITERQEKMMGQDPFMVRSLAQHIADDFRERGIADVEVHADSFATLNGRPLQRLIRADVDLAEATPPDWIVPLDRARLDLDLASFDQPDQ